MFDMSSTLFLLDRQNRNISLAKVSCDILKLEFCYLSFISSVGESDWRKRLKIKGTANLWIFSRSHTSHAYSKPDLIIVLYASSLVLRRELLSLCFRMLNFLRADEQIFSMWEDRVSLLVNCYAKIFLTFCY